MNRYWKLIMNTVIFAIGTFSSKLMVLLLMPLYTRVLTTADYGTMDVVVSVSNMLLPLVALSISDGVIRFGLDRSSKKSDVFSIGLATSLAGFLLFLCAYPLMKKIAFISDFVWLIYLYLFAASMQSVTAQFVRSMGLVRLYAFNGMFNTFCTIVCNILFLVVFQWGINGYILSVIVSNLLSMVFLWWAAKLWQYVKFKGVSSQTARAMLVYSIPLIPATIMWSITNVSDRLMVTYFLGESANGLYAVANKLPTIISLISSIFTQAWQLSAISENDQKDRDAFYSNIFQSYQTVVFLAGCGLLWLIRPLTRLMYAEAYFESWQIAPFLVISVVFSCFSSFYASFYMATKKNMMAMVTTLAGAVMNISLNLWLIPIYGVQGAAFATASSYLTVFFIRAIDTRRLVKLKMDLPRFLLNTLLLVAQGLIMLRPPEMLFLIQMGIVALMFLLNGRSIMWVLNNLLDSVKRRAIQGE